MTVLVTGGAGYIGSHCAQALLDRGRKVAVLDDLSTGSEALIPNNPNLWFTKGSVGDKDRVRALIEDFGITAVMHFAGFIKVAESVENPEKYFRNNTENAKILMETCREAGVKRFIFSSTAAVYGNPAHIPVTELSPLQPINPYGESKLRAERILRKAFDGDGFRHVTLRYFNVAGCDPKGRYGYTIEQEPTHLIRAALAVLLGRQKELEVFGIDYPTKDGTCVRDFIHVSDLVDIHIEALKHLEEGGGSGTYNCGYGHGYSVLEVVETIKRVTGKQFPVQFADRRLGDPPMLVASTAGLKRAFAWRPSFDSLEDMIAHQLKWEESQMALV